jgi:excisionase family DNA binding protein
MERTGASFVSQTKTCDADLLRLYLEMPRDQRHERFAGTARVARLTGLSQRTVLTWIGMGAIRAVSIGRKYQVDLDTLREYLRLMQPPAQHGAGGRRS